MLKHRIFILFSFVISKCSGINSILDMHLVSTKTFMFWENATIPFYINPDHFDHEQALTIMTTLSTFAFKTCLKFLPVLAPPEENQHVLTFINPDGVKRCKVQAQGHTNFHPHLVHLGYECLESPHLDMVVMRALGFPFEHNRMSRELFIDVMIENIEPSAVELFTKDSSLPPALRALPYDINSVMHFDERQYSKNGHRTIIFKNSNTRQQRGGLSETDLKKIEVVYGAECRKRDRQEKIELCQSYPGVARRRKREVEIEPPANKSLRVNPDITPPPIITETPEPVPLQEEIDNQDSEYLTASLKALGIANETEDIIEKVYKVSALALRNARAKYCNVTSNGSTPGFDFDKSDKKRRSNSSDILGILEVIADYAKTMVDNAVSNLTVFCENSESIETYQRRQCDWSFGNRCPQTYRSTKTGPVRHSTQHRPVYKQPTKHVGGLNKYSYDKQRRNADEEDTTPALVPIRRKREAADITTNKPKEEDKEKNKEKKIVKEKAKVAVKEKIDSDKGGKNNSTIKVKVTNVNDTNTEGDRKSELRRYFQRRRYKVKKTETGSDLDFEDSNISLEKDKEVKKPDPVDYSGQVKRVKDEKDYYQDKEDEDDEDQEEDQELEIAAEKIINKEELVKEVLNEGLEKIIGSKKEAIKKSVEQSKEYAEEKAEAEQKIEPITEKEEVDGSEKAESTETDKALEIEKPVEEEIEVETTTQKKKRRKVKKVKQDIQENEVEKPKEKEGRLKKKRKDLLKQKNRSENVPMTVKLNKLNQEFYNERKWPDGKVRYVIKRIPEYDLEDLRNRMAEVNSILMEKTCVRLYEVDAKEAQGYDDYLVLDTSPDYVTGRVGGKQIFGSVELFRGGQHKQHTAMMVMAMLGFYFEVSRHDRDRYIRVHMRHVRPDKLHHFEKIRDEATLDVPYDYQSATHPAWQFWRKIGKTGISTVATYKEQDPDGSVMRSLGQNPQLLSEYDIIKINSVYGVECFQNKRAVEKENKTKARRNHSRPKQ